MKESSAIQQEVTAFMSGLEKRNQGESEFIQAVRESAETIIPYIADHSKYRDARILERLSEPDRIISFRVSWEDDHGDIQVDRAWRCLLYTSDAADDM
jgi:glutamate dehydrogenase (NADP+)